MVQTTLRAEITAVVSALWFAVFHRCKCYIWTDSQTVYDRVTSFATCDTMPIFDADRDLWQQLWEVWQTATAARYFERIIKVRSHQDQQLYSDIIDQWATRGNDAADLWALRARALLPKPLRIAHAQAVKDQQQQHRARDHVHSIICAVGTQAVEAKPARHEADEQAWEDVDREAGKADSPSFVPLPTSCPDLVDSALGDNALRLYNWLRRLVQAPGATPRWVTSYELLVHYQACTGHVVFWFNTAKRAFQDASDVYRQKDHDFLKMSGWFQGALKLLASLLGTRYESRSMLPHSSVFKCWTRCILIGIAPSEHTLVGTWLAPVQNGRVKSVRKAFGQLPTLTSLRF